MKSTAFLLGSALSLGGGLLLGAAAAQAQGSACSAEIMSVQRQLTGTPTMASGSHTNPGATVPGVTSADPGPAPLPAPGAAAPTPGATLGGAGPR